MPRLFERLRDGRKWWPAEFAFRLAGLALLLACWRLAGLALRWIDLPPHHPATLAEFALCAAAFVLLAAGLALGGAGPGLVRRMPIPKRSLGYRARALRG